MRTWAFLGDARDRLHRCGRKPIPVVYLDLETRARMLDREGKVLAYKIGDHGTPVVVLPWEAACARKDWAEAERLQHKMFATIRKQQQLDRYEDLAWADKSWLAKKFLTFAAWSRTLLKR